MVVQKSLSGSILQYEMDNIYDPLKQGGSPGGGRSSSNIRGVIYTRGNIFDPVGQGGSPGGGRSSSKGSSGRMRKVR